jgi:hypothetical protein
MKLGNFLPAGGTVVLISGFRHGANEVFALLGFYAA